ncbi:cytochrome P450 [Paraphaeosphaeria sporulosa]|uniref:Cytochrome P450 n=1 Tax=Paraphaeosphaeria sporulosa TaxID=1460663 RepID=A0A177CCU0_9PLEO|nr:cytochrome P450 [Paraphaeosphaeria sporulosa]OAG05453.1 cytochrome P450 [Paraphaeosphaeria sporulosa]
MFFLFPFAGFALWYIYSTFNYRSRRNGATEIPGPKGLPIVGNVLDMPKDSQLIPVFNKWYREYGDLVSFKILGINQVVLNIEKAANDLFVQRGNSYSDRGAPTAIADDTWRQHRKLLHTVLSAPATVRYEPFIELETIYTLHDLLISPEKFSDHLERYAYGIVFRVGLGRRVQDLNDYVVQESIMGVDETLKAFRPDLFACNIWPPLLHAPDWLVPSNKTLRRYLARLEGSIDLVQSDLKARIKNRSAPESLQKWFLEHMHEFDLTEEHGAWVFQSLVGAGTRSPYNAMMQYTINMMEHPEWQRKVQEEVDRVVGKDRLPSFEDLSNLPTVRAVIKEGIRYRSIVAEIGIPHKLDRDDFYEGYFIPKGTILHANYSAILSDRELYPDGPVYNPARWLDPSYPTYKEPLTSYPSLQGFTSFGYGRRACPAANFTERTLTVIVARLAWAFNIRKKVDPTTKMEIPLDIKYEPTPNPKPLPFPAVFEVRDQERARVIKVEEARESARDPLRTKKD